MGYKYPLLDETGMDIAVGIHAIAKALGAQEKMTFKRLQQIVRTGRIDDYFAIGDEIDVERATGVSASTSRSELTASVNDATFYDKVESLHGGVYSFTYENGWNNAELGNGLDMAYYGISVSGTPANGDVITVTVTAQVITFVYVAKDKDKPSDPSLKHSMTLHSKHIFANRVFGSAEAIIYASAAMPAGTYHFNLYKPGNIYYLNAALQNKDVQFTTTVDIPAGGQLVVTTGNFRDSTSVDALKLTSYDSKGSTTALEANIACVEGTVGTDLGRANDAANNTKINSTDRCVYGSNNWEYSGIRQWLNSDKAGGSWYVAKGPFSRPYGNADVQGWEYGIEKDFLDCLQEVALTTGQNWFDGGQAKVTYDKWFIPSNAQIWFEEGGAADKSWDYYKLFSDNAAASYGVDSNRIKTLNGSATYWWTRTPVGWDSGGEYLVYPTGQNDYGGAISSRGVAPACVIA